MSAQTVITCDSCGARKIFRNGSSPSTCRRFRTLPAGWKTKRSEKITVTMNKGTPREWTSTFTEALDFCPDCVALGHNKTTTTAIL